MSDTTYPGLQGPTAGANDRNATAFQIAMAQSRMATAMLVKVLSVAPGGVGSTGTVTVQQMVHQVSGAGNAVPHGPTYNVPYGRLQGGTNAIVMDPAVGDIGLAVFASRDIASVKATRAPALPGSARKYSASDALYVPAFLNGTPTQYVEFAAGGINVVSPGTVTIKAPTTAIDGDLTVTGEVTARFGGASVTLAEHEHPTAPEGAPSAPTPGT